MSTRETVAGREETLVQAPEKTGASSTSFAQLPSFSLLLKLVYLGSDLISITLGHMLAVRALEHFLHVPIGAVSTFGYHRVYIPFFAVLMYALEGYKSPELRRPEQELERSCKAVTLSFLGLIFFNFVVFRSELFSRYLLAAWFGLALSTLLFMRCMLRVVLGALWNAGLYRRRALLLGSASDLAEYCSLLTIQRHRGYDFVGLLLESPQSVCPPGELANIPVLGPFDQWKEAVSETRANVVVVAHRSILDDPEWRTNVLRQCRELRVDVELYCPVLATPSSLYEQDEFTGCFHFYATPRWSFKAQRVVKRAIDIGVGVVGSVVTLLLTPLIWLLVNLEDRGPVFYRSAYLAQDGTTQYYLKFRTMLVNADHILERDSSLRSRFSEKHKLIDDPRVTKIGRFLRRCSLDECPQFFSIVKGDLSLVGPRTIRQEEAERYGPLLDRLLTCRPGLTGFWQVMGRQTTSYRERVLMDMFYIERWSIWLDLVIIARTFWIVLTAEGAY
jgi:exopolysaccharide biosynthesis polyprenyl glycosylphosphotransferase